MIPKHLKQQVKDLIRVTTEIQNKILNSKQNSISPKNKQTTNRIKLRDDNTLTNQSKFSALRSSPKFKNQDLDVDD